MFPQKPQSVIPRVQSPRPHKEARVESVRKPKKLGTTHPYFEGHFARDLGAERSDNPYAENTSQCFWWDEGWMSIEQYYAPGDPRVTDLAKHQAHHQR